VLTNASAVARYVGAGSVTAAHLVDAIAILLGEKAMEDLGRPVSPLAHRSAGAPLEVDPLVRELVRRWFDRLGSEPMSMLTDHEVAAFRAELEHLRDR
jgi:hypothetical protein